MKHAKLLIFVFICLIASTSLTAPRENNLEPVFVYGTLKKGERLNYHMRRSTYVGKAETIPRYILYDVGSYPAMKEGGRKSIYGELYLVDRETLARLDRVEGVPYHYKRVKIKLKKPYPHREAWGYIYARSVRNLEEIGCEWPD